MSPTRRQPGRLPSDAVIARGAVAVLAVFVLVGGALFLLSFLGDDDGGGTATPSRSASPLPTEALTPSDSSSASPSPTASSTEPSDEARARRMTAFVRDYLATVTRDPGQAWSRLTPAFQRSSGGLTAYERFWDGVRRAEPTAIRADPARMTVEYDVAYVRTDGSRSTDHPRLLLRRDGDGFRIAGEA